MNLNIKVFLLCPVPDDQKPINEYINLKENTLFNVLAFSKKNYFSKILVNFLVFFFLGTPFSFLFKLNDQLFLFNTFFAINFLIFLFFVNFSLWFQLLNQFRSTRLFYEEGSWYDGQFWEKPIELIKNDKLISQQKIKPILNRIFKTLINLILLNSYLLLNYF
jgi:hypothetical protein